MCDLISAATFAISAYQAYSQYQGEKQQAATTRDNAIKSYEVQNNQIAMQQQQEAEAAAEQMTQRSQDAMRSLGRLNAIGAEGGLSGGSFGRLAVENNIAANADNEAIKANRNNAISNAQSGAQANYTQTQGRIAAARDPSLFGTAIQIGAAGLDSYSGYKVRKARGY